MQTTYLDIMGVTLFCLFAYAVWPPAVLLAASASAIAISWALERTKTATEDDQ